MVLLVKQFLKVLLKQNTARVPQKGSHHVFHVHRSSSRLVHKRSKAKLQ